MSNESDFVVLSTIFDVSTKVLPYLSCTNAHSHVAFEIPTVIYFNNVNN